MQFWSNSDWQWGIDAALELWVESWQMLMILKALKLSLDRCLGFATAIDEGQATNHDVWL